MEVILLERIHKLGQMGEVVKVRNGYGRNYLIPQGKALNASKAALADFEKRRVQLEARNLELKTEAQKLAATVDGRSVVQIRQAGEAGNLFGSVTSRDVAAALTDDGVSIDYHQIRLEQPIKTSGLHAVVVALHPEVEVTITVNVARSAEEAEIQAGRAAPAAEDDGTEVDDSDDDDDLEAQIMAIR
ncbi:MAG TPA: 50S ribosomal protein L9 [Geminicoccus sp.]|jgi:large subunit ribosomal protein L9|uniref:50S ribosomal protein L9 n=1 Tax=Geminicoccus sp. TaxID=2024832 RepID=UPI002E341F43|nr:50S ribosomal protein L9 [Geminicoccus sp.]HEX2527472.1 50S ribosomal protein L9 [Geminicoccus sp.]